MPRACPTKLSLQKAKRCPSAEAANQKNTMQLYNETPNKATIPKGAAQLQMLSAAGIDAAPRRNKPCPACGGNDRFTLFADGRHFCRQCGGGDAIDLIRKTCQCSFKEALLIGGGSHARPAPMLSQQKSKEPDLEAKIKKAREIIAQSKMLCPGTEAWRYLVETRKLPADLLKFDLRCIDRLPYYEQDADGKPVATGHYAALVAPVRSRAGEVIAAHLTYLLNGQKAPVANPKKIVGSPKGGTIRLSFAYDEVGLAEGIETAIAARAIFNKPVWAVMSASLAPFVELPPSIETALIYADRDESKAGQIAAYKLTEQLETQGITIGSRKTPANQNDFYDIYAAGLPQ